jgi:hypothetical protein
MTETEKEAQKQKFSTLSITVDRQHKLDLIALRSHEDKTELIGQWIDAVFTIMTDGIQESTRMSIASYADLKTSCVKTYLAPLFMGLEGLNAEQVAEVKKAFGYGPNFEDLREKPKTHCEKIEELHNQELEKQKKEESS